MPWHLTVVACLQARLHMTGQLADSPSLLTWAIAVSPRPGHGFVTRSLPRAVAQGKYKTPPSGEWVTYENAARGDRMHQVLPVSVETFTILEMVLDVFWHI